MISLKSAGLQAERQPFLTTQIPRTTSNKIIERFRNQLYQEEHTNHKGPGVEHEQSGGLGLEQGCWTGMLVGHSWESRVTPVCPGLCWLQYRKSSVLGKQDSGRDGERQ